MENQKIQKECTFTPKTIEYSKIIQKYKSTMGQSMIIKSHIGDLDEQSQI